MFLLVAVPMLLLVASRGDKLLLYPLSCWMALKTFPVSMLNVRSDPPRPPFSLVVVVALALL